MQNYLVQPFEKNGVRLSSSNQHELQAQMSMKCGTSEYNTIAGKGSSA